MSAEMVPAPHNPVGLQGIAFVELAAPEPARLAELLRAFGFSRTMRHAEEPIELWEQGEIRFLVNRRPRGHAARFAAAHGPSIPSLGWRVADPAGALAIAAARGAHPAEHGDLAGVPAVEGLGGSLLYLVPALPAERLLSGLGFVPLERPERVAPAGFLAIDHLTNNVAKGEMARWAAFYKDVFGFTEVRHFDIRGEHTGLTSYALRSPCGSFCIPINEADEAKSQINEYLEEYRGPGVQHLAFLTRDLVASLRALDGGPIRFLDIEPGYHDAAFARVPGVREDHDELRRRSVLVDGDAEGYLLQIFTRNLIGPIFVELIQRENHQSFGEGNFGALFRSIERDQARRGVFAPGG